MGTMAQNWANKCVLEHSNTKEYGENLAMVGSTGSLGSEKSLWKQGMEGWVSEKSTMPSGKMTNIKTIL